MADGGYTPQEISRFTLGHINALFVYWDRNPSIRMMLAGFFGIKPRASAASPAQSATTSIDAIRAQFPDGVMR